MPNYVNATEIVWRDAPTPDSKVAHYLSPDDARIPHYPPTGCEVIYEEEQHHDHA